jgi:hypothetical protein
MYNTFYEKAKTKMDSFLSSSYQFTYIWISSPKALDTEGLIIRSIWYYYLLRNKVEGNSKLGRKMSNHISIIY